jgi:hypothetical protein
MASNIQRGTRGLSAGDWIRLKRVKGSQTYLTDMPSDIANPPPSVIPKTGRRVFTEFGISKTRRSASNYTDYVASQKSDYIVETYNAGSGKTLSGVRLCDCNITVNPVKHTTTCTKCGKNGAPTRLVL